MLHRVGDLVGGDALGAGLDRERLKAVEPLAVGRGHLGLHRVAHLGAVGLALAPDLGRHRAWLDDRNLDPERAHLKPQRVADRLDRVLRGVVGGEEGKRPPAADRGHEDDPAAGGADHLEQRLGHRDLADHVDLELAPQLVELQRLDRPGDGDARVVDQCRQPPAGRLADPLGGGGDLLARR